MTEPAQLEKEMRELTPQQLDALDSFTGAYLAEVDLLPSQVEMVTYDEYDPELEVTKKVWRFRRREPSIAELGGPVFPVMPGEEASLERRYEYLLRLNKVHYARYQKELAAAQAELAQERRALQKLVDDLRHPLKLWFMRLVRKLFPLAKD